MGLDNYLDPTYGVTEWTAFLECPDCKEDTEHEFVKKHGVITAWCTTCDYESDIDGDEY